MGERFLAVALSAEAQATLKAVETEILLSLITLLGVVVTAFVTWLIAQRRLMGEHVTAERTKWRSGIRKKALAVHDAIVSGNTDDASKLQNEFRALLSPFDENDQKILCLIDAKGDYDCRKDRARAFGKSISLLLKHDWERAKLESGFSPRRWFVDAKRSSFKDAYGTDGKCCPKTLRCWEKFEIKWKRSVVYLVLFLPVIVGLIVLWFRTLEIVFCYGSEMMKRVWEIVF